MDSIPPLPVSLVNRRDHFINLPKMAVRAMYGSNIPSGAVAFELKWQSARRKLEGEEDEDGDGDEDEDEEEVTNIAYAAWRGGYSSQAKLEIPQSMADCINLNDAQATGTQLFVQVNKTTCSRVKSINLDPMTEDDWEMLELHASRLEESMLEQVCILYPGQIFSVSVGPSCLIRLKVGNVSFDDGAPCGILGRDSELVIAPRERKKRKGNEKEEGKSKKNDSRGDGKEINDKKNNINHEPEQDIGGLREKRG